MGLDCLWHNVVLYLHYYNEEGKDFLLHQYLPEHLLCARNKDSYKIEHPDPLPREPYHLAGETKMQTGPCNTAHYGL